VIYTSHPSGHLTRNKARASTRRKQQSLRQARKRQATSARETAYTCIRPPARGYDRRCRNPYTRSVAAEFILLSVSVPPLVPRHQPLDSSLSDKMYGALFQRYDVSGANRMSGSHNRTLHALWPVARTLLSCTRPTRVQRAMSTGHCPAERGPVRSKQRERRRR
jgi:hypothetical protein